MHSVMLVWSLKFVLIFSDVSRLIFGLIRYARDRALLIFESHDGPDYSRAHRLQASKYTIVTESVYLFRATKCPIVKSTINHSH